MVNQVTPKKEPLAPNKKGIDPTIKPHKIKKNISQLNNKNKRNYYSLPFWKNKIIYILAFILICGMAFIYWSINRPMPDADNPTVVNTPVEKTSEASLMFYQGEVYQQSNKQSWEKINSSTNLQVNDSIKTMSDSWATIQFKNGALCRLNANTEIKIIKADKDEIIIEQIYGQVYHYTNKNEKTLAYKVNIENTTFTALTESLNTFNNRQTITGQIFSDSLQINHKDTSKIIEQPTTVNINLQDDIIEEIKITEDTELFNYDWLNWNNQQNKLLSLNLLDIPLNENWPKEMTLEAEVIEEGIIEFSWQYDEDYEDEPPYGFYLLIGNEKDPTYPKNSYTHISPDIEKPKTTWSNLADGEYNFRAGVFDGDKDIVLYSNNINITLPEEKPAEITLIGEIQNNKALLNWTSNNIQSEDNWKILIAENQTPTYPYNTNQDLNITSNSYTWENLSPDKTYQFRICEYIQADDECRSYSNTIHLTTDAIENNDDDYEAPADSLKISTKYDNGDILITWENLKTDSNYLLTINRAFAETQNIAINASQNSYRFENPMSGKTYFISLCQINNNNNCIERSNESKITIP